MPTQRVKSLLVLPVLFALTACGGGGGGGGGSVTPPPPPPPPASVTYTVSLTAMTLTDRQTDDAVTATGLPVSGATATRD